MTQEIKLDFIDAKTREKQQAIQACPGYDSAVKRAIGESFVPRRIMNLAGECPVGRECDVRMSFTPNNSKRLTISGICTKTPK